MMHLNLRAATLVMICLLFAGCVPASGQATENSITTSPNANENVSAGNNNVNTNQPSTMEPSQEAIGEQPAEGQPATIENLTTADLTVGLEKIADGFVHPLVFTSAPDNSGRMFVADQIGVIYVMAPDGSVDMDNPFLDLRDRMIELNPEYDERGLLGLAFHPDYANNGRFFVYYSASLREDGPAGWSGTSHISEFHLSPDDPNKADPNSEKIVLEIDKPHPTHNGGQIAFGPDGYLYIPLGDGGGPADADTGHVDDWYDVNQGGNGQDTSHNLLGSLLRIDIDHGDPYAIPADNPIPPGGDKPTEQWAWGFRNLYRISFDSGGDHWLYGGDVGQNQWEEVDVLRAGGNYGWNVKEGTHCFSTESPDKGLPTCPVQDLEGNPLLNPVIEFKNINHSFGVGLVVIGGNVYRGSAIPELEGKYVFGSWSVSWSTARGQLFIATPGSLDGGLWTMQALPNTENNLGRLDGAVLSFGEGPDGELYVLMTGEIGPQGNTGAIWKIVPAQ